jgi:hypothetical protein
MPKKKQITEPVPLGDLTTYQLSRKVQRIARTLRKKPKRRPTDETIAELFQIASFLTARHFKK